MSRRRLAVLCALALPILAAGIITAAWAIAGRDETTTSSGVTVGGRDVEGLGHPELVARVEEVASRFPASTVHIEARDVSIDTTAAELGLQVDVAATTAAAQAVGRHDPGPAGPLRWLKSLAFDRPVALRLAVDRAQAIETIERLEGDRRTNPVEPALSAKSSGVTAVPGKPGVGIDVDDVMARLPTTATRAPQRITIRTARRDTRPTVTDDAVARLARTADTVTKGDITITSGSVGTKIAGKDLRPGFGLAITGSTPSLTLDAALVGRLLSGATAATGGTNPTGVTFTQVDGRMVPVAGHDAQGCCAADAPQRIVDALLAGRTTVDLPPTTVSAADGVAWAGTLGVQEVIGQFTTKHPAGQPRVTNIHRISDLTRGVLIAPGATFSVNDFVGERTAEKGFVQAPVIEEGQFSTDFGGGVSQFATTLFNASFFGGLDIPEHKAHSIYISRYPFGREATLAYPSVDLKVRNNTPYGVVIWPTYTGTSITVQLWSTKFASGQQTAQSATSGCGKVSVTRTRSFVDGHTDQQTYRADYNCNPPKHP